MSSDKFTNWRGYLYIALGVGFGVYRAMKSEGLSSLDWTDVVISVGMVGVGLYLVIRD